MGQHAAHAEPVVRLRGRGLAAPVGLPASAHLRLRARVGGHLAEGPKARLQSPTETTHRLALFLTLSNKLVNCRQSPPPNFTFAQSFADEE